MEFKRFQNWVENAHRTGCKSAYYPPQYDTHGFADKSFPLIHMSIAADLLVWNSLNVPKMKWRSFEDFKKLEKKKCYFPQVK